jgi:hypothetical protein
MSSQKKIEASRTNGAKSNGPATPEGKQRSSQNSLKHGLCSRRILLPDESPDELHALEVHWLRQLWPMTPAERELVLNVVSAAWRMQRYDRLEAGLLAIEMAKHPADPNAAAQAFHDLATGSRALDLLNRYAARARREFNNALEIYRQTVDQRRRDMSRDEGVITDEDFERKWGREPGWYCKQYSGQVHDNLPNEPDFPGVIPSPPDELADDPAM